MTSRLSWPQIKQSDEYRGLWVALDECRYDARTAQPVEGSVVDADEDLVALCSRMQAGDNRHCAILFCDGEVPAAPVPSQRARLSSSPPSERGLSHSPPFEPQRPLSTPRHPRDSVPPEEALERLRAGNRRFVAGEGSAVRQWRPALVDGQWPFAVILGCADSRAPAEYVFDQGLGDLFVIRVAGNIIAPSLVGSVEFAASQFGTRLVVVMGHTHCGAVAATVRALTDLNGPESRNIQSIVDRIAPHIEDFRGTALTDQARLAEAVKVNALASARELSSASHVLQAMVARGRVQIVTAVFDLSTGVVSFVDA